MLLFKLLRKKKIPKDSVRVLFVGREYWVRVDDLGVSLKTFKTSVGDATGVKWDEQEVEFNGVILTDDKRSVESYGVKHESTLTMKKVLDDSAKAEISYLTAEEVSPGSSKGVQGGTLIHIKMLTGEKLDMMVNLKDTVASLKAAIQAKNGIAPDQQRLMFAGKQLADSATLSSYNISQNSSLHLVIRLT